MRRSALLAVFELLLLSAADGQDYPLGARAKALGGAGSAFEDDPHSLWINPAGSATQPDGFAVSLQTYPFYKESGEPLDRASARAGFNDPVFIPSFVGALFQVGSPELPQAVGIAAVTPMHLYFPFNGPNPTTPPTDAVIVDQTFHRLRFSYAIDLRLRPVAEPGFLTHAAVGIGVDLSLSRLEYTSPPENENSPVEHDLAFSGGLGVLIGVFDNVEDFRVSLGLSYQAPAAHGFGTALRAPLGIVPAFDFPQQVEVGLAVHLLERMPLRLCLEALWTDWENAARASQLPGISGFKPAYAIAMGAEYRIDLTPTVGLLPRAGLRCYQPPWRSAERAELPAWGGHQLFIDTRSSRFWIASFGIGLAWGYKEGTQDALDLAVEVGGDAPSLSLSYAYQF